MLNTDFSKTFVVLTAAALLLGIAAANSALTLTGDLNMTDQNADKILVGDGESLLFSGNNDLLTLNDSSMKLDFHQNDVMGLSLLEGVQGQSLVIDANQDSVRIEADNDNSNENIVIDNGNGITLDSNNSSIEMVVNGSTALSVGDGFADSDVFSTSQIDSIGRGDLLIDAGAQNKVQITNNGIEGISVGSGGSNEDIDISADGQVNLASNQNTTLSLDNSTTDAHLDFPNSEVLMSENSQNDSVVETDIASLGSALSLDQVNLTADQDCDSSAKGAIVRYSGTNPQGGDDPAGNTATENDILYCPDGTSWEIFYDVA